MNNDFIQSIIDEGLNNYSDSPFLRRKRNIVIDLIVDRAEKRGLRTHYHENNVFEVIGYGKSVVFHQNAPENSVVATAITPNKSRTKRILAQRQLPVPQGRLFDEYEHALHYFLSCEMPQVVKPNAGALARGVTANITGAAEFEKAWASAREEQNEVIVEDYIAGDYLRVFVIGGRAAGAFACVPAHVIGNGTDNITEIIAAKNKQRSLNPATKAYPIKRIELLQSSGYLTESVPAAGQRVELTAVANVAAGGETIEVVDRIHPSLLVLAEQAVRAIPGLHVAGVDMIVKDYLASGLPHNAVILEINTNPALDDHVFPMYGKSVDIPDLLIDFVLRDDRIGQKTRAEDFPVYVSSCDERAFSRNYNLQIEVIKHAAHKHNLRVEELSSLIFTLSSETQSVGFNQGMSDRTTSVSRMASNRKDWTKRLLKTWGVTTPQGESFTVDQRESAWRFAQTLARPVVVKPRSGSGGKGVSVDVSTRDHFDVAWEFARKTKPRAILVEEFFRAHDFRLFVVGDRVRAAAQRVPAYLVGDGMHTLQELVDKKNQVRRTNPYLGSKLIKITDMMNFNLVQQGITTTTVLEEGQYLRLHSVANIGSGGESRDVSEIMHADFTPIAVRARKAVFDAAYAGIDLLAEDIAKAPHEQRWMVIEVNTNPDVALHHFPCEGVPRNAAGAILEHLFPEISSRKPAMEKSVSVLVKGKVQGVGYRSWVWRNAHLHALSGWVRNKPDGSVEAIFRGAPNAVENMLVLCKTGSTGTVVEDLVALPYEGKNTTGFIIDETGENDTNAHGT